MLLSLRTWVSVQLHRMTPSPPGQVPQVREALPGVQHNWTVSELQGLNPGLSGPSCVRKSPFKQGQPQGCWGPSVSSRSQKDGTSWSHKFISECLLTRSAGEPREAFQEGFLQEAAGTEARSSFHGRP